LTPPPEGLAGLQALGFELPGPAYLFGAIVFGLVGLAAFRSGRRRSHPRRLWMGVALMVYPYAVSSTVWLYAIGAALCAGLWFDRGG
jgi:hypothetical protein